VRVVQRWMNDEVSLSSHDKADALRALNWGFLARRTSSCHSRFLVSNSGASEGVRLVIVGLPLMEMPVAPVPAIERRFDRGVNARYARLNHADVRDSTSPKRHWGGVEMHAIPCSAIALIVSKSRFRHETRAFDNRKSSPLGTASAWLGARGVRHCFETYISELERGVRQATVVKVDSLAAVMQVHPLTVLTLSYCRTPSPAEATSLLARVSDEIKELAAAPASKP
jgi:hypothetical protein